MNRRNFLKGLLIVPVAPAIVKADNIMNIAVLAESSWKHAKEKVLVGSYVDEGGFLVPPEFRDQIMAHRSYTGRIVRIPIYKDNTVEELPLMRKEYNKLLRVVNHE